MIVSKNITKSFGNLKVLKGVDLTVERGEVVSIVGPSGAGKSTFLQIMGTLSRPDSGEILINGVSVFAQKQDTLAQFRNKHIGFVFQFHHLLPEFTALENVCIPGFIAKADKTQTLDRATELLDFLGLSERMEHKPDELSGGEQQRVAVARALMNKPDIILADEPSGNLDSHNRTELHKLFFELRNKFNQTIVIVTHDETLAAMSDKKLTMIDGNLASIKEIKE
ncbi:MAG: ABC transporter ATP-binding protein [Prevotellaceae bacterium]|jgi:lipoprotein-releasing system ATP-binding protein|nr:ABC transporter ATP-binding protein [Prevotellaceae bacterium]